MPGATATPRWLWARAKSKSQPRTTTLSLRGMSDRYCLSSFDHVSAELPRIMVDRVQLQQVFVKPRSNAIEAMKDSGGEFTGEVATAGSDAALVHGSDQHQGSSGEGRSGSRRTVFSLLQALGNDAGFQRIQFRCESRGDRYGTSSTGEQVQQQPRFTSRVAGANTLAIFHQA